MSSLKIASTRDVELASAVVCRSGLLPSRVVLRKLHDGELVTHVETFNATADGLAHREYVWGHYFDATDRARAVADFHERVGRL